MRRVGIASSSQLAADAGAAVADAGGNAVDAAVAAVLVSMCTDIGVMAPGGGAFLTIWPSDGLPVVVDAYAEMPGRGMPEERFGRGGREVWMDYGGGMTTIVGAGSVAVPGAIAGMALAVERYGSIPWREIFVPAIDAARNGFPLLGAAAQYLVYSHEAVFGWLAESAAIVHRADGSPVGLGDVITLPQLADTLQALADEGPGFLYRGDLGAAIVAAIQEQDGLLTMADLEAYRPVVREPTLVDLDDWSVATNPPPAVGGACMAAMLLLGSRGDRSPWNAASVAAQARIQQVVLDYRRNRLDADTSDRAAEAERLLDAARVGDLRSLMTSPSTVHTSAVDSEGTSCAITASAGYGSGMMAPGTGFWLNNSLGETELHPEGFHGLEPGTRLLSNMAPTAARSRSGACLAVGSPGADRITTALSSVLLNFIHKEMSLHDAVNHPRIHAEMFGSVPSLAYEPGMNVGEVDGLEPRRFPDISMYFGGVQAALWDRNAGHFEAADPRREGGTARGGATER